VEETFDSINHILQLFIYKHTSLTFRT